MDTTVAPNALVKALRLLFVISVVFFLLAGLAIVVGQAIHLLGGNATAARGVASTLGPWAFGGAALAGMLSFALEYTHTRGVEDDDD